MGNTNGQGVGGKRNSLSWDLSFYFLLAENQDKYLLCNITDKAKVPYRDWYVFLKSLLAESLGTEHGPWQCQQAGWAWPPTILNRPDRHIIVKSRGGKVYSLTPWCGEEQIEVLVTTAQVHLDVLTCSWFKQKARGMPK